jgi:hypothetical protein
MRVIAVMIPPLFVITTEWAQPNGTTSRRKSQPMQTESQIRTMPQFLISTRKAGWLAFVSRKPQGLDHGQSGSYAMPGGLAI